MVMIKPGRRRRITASKFGLYFLLLVGALPFTTFLANAAVWTNTAEDRFFCGFKWNEDNCPKRQHCPTGESEECEGFEDGVKCFANTNCDTRYGDGDSFSGNAPKQAPQGSPRPTHTGKSEDLTDHYWCGVGHQDAKNKCGVHCPGGTSDECPEGHVCYHDIYVCDFRNVFPPTAQPITPDPTMTPSIQGPTKIPTDMPIGPPPPLGPSDDLTDNWFCGIGINDANAKCRVHCPSASECPMGQICYFGTECDARTHMPTPPPSRRPTPFPTVPPTVSPTFTMMPTPGPTHSDLPTAAPSLPIPTMSPTPAPSKRPTYAPMPSLQSTYFCGLTWNDAINNCKRRCPTGESTECPFDEFCFSLTPCTEEMGYPEEYGLGEGGGKSDPAGLGSGSGLSEDCVPLKISIVADHWPKETSWMVEDTALEDTEHSVIVESNGSEGLIPGESRDYVECLNDRNGCYQFTIKDSGGDGICCEHGNGSYKVSYDGVELKQGAAFYDSEATPFGGCGETEPPTKKPTAPPKMNPSSGGGSSSGSGGTSGSSSYRCINTPLVESGYVVSSDKCDLFDDCFNTHINVGDDWFCEENAQCVEAPACGAKKDEGSYHCVATQLAESGYVVSSEKCDLFDSCLFEGDNCDEGSTCVKTPKCGEEKVSDSVPSPAESTTLTNPPTKLPTKQPTSPKPIASRPKPVPQATSKQISSSPTLRSKPKSNSPTLQSKPESNPPTLQSKPKSNSPTLQPISTVTEGPTMNPTTYRPTYGPCGGDECYQDDHCRSKYGFCGPGDTYCTDDAIWTKDCPAAEPSRGPSPSPISESPTDSPVTNPPVTLTPTDSTPASGSHDDSNQGTEPQADSTPPTMRPSTKKPVFIKPGGGKPKPIGGKGSPSKPSKPSGKETLSKPSTPARTQSPISFAAPPTPEPSTMKPTNSPTELLVITSGPTVSTVSPSSSPISFIGAMLDTTARPSPRPTWPPSNRPTDGPTDEPTPWPTSRPTRKPTPSPSSKPTPSPLESKDSSPVVVVPGCEGEPCPVDTHCRSRYGSCGPGFIYCNANTIWQKSCPSVIPGTRPTRMPTTKPTKSPELYVVKPFTPSTTVAPQSVEPTIPPFSKLAKPSLPTITEAIPFALPSSFSAAKEVFAESDEAEEIFAESDEAEDEDPNLIEEESTREPSLAPLESGESTDNQSPGYLNEWVRSATCHACAQSALWVFFAITTTFVLLLY